MTRLLHKLLCDRRGATAIEYGLILALMVIVLIAGASSLGGSVRGKWGNIAGNVSAVETM